MTPHRYLFDEHVHSFYPTLAERIGLNEAIVIQQIHSWIQTYLRDPERYRQKHYHDGAWWIWNSYPDWHKKLPYLSESTIKRTLTSLRKQGLVRVGNYNTLKIDRTYWYTIDYSGYDRLWANPRYTDQETKMESPSDQNDLMEETILTSPLPSSSPSSSASKEPALPDSSPGGDSQDVAFWAEGETPPEQAPQEPAEQGKARRADKFGTDPFSVASVVEQKRSEVEHPDFADPSMDGKSAWTDVYYSFGEAFLQMNEDQLDRKPNKDTTIFKLRELATEVKATPSEAARVMRPLAVLEDWVVGPAATPYNTRLAEAFQNALLMDWGQFKESALAKLQKGKRNGGSSGARNGHGAQVEGNGFRAMPQARVR